MVALAEWIQQDETASGEGGSFASTRLSELDTQSKNRVWNFFEESPEPRLEIEPQVVEAHLVVWVVVEYDASACYKYLYVHGNPVMGIDPSGNYTLSLPGLAAVTAVIGDLAALAVPTIKVATYAGAALVVSVGLTSSSSVGTATRHPTIALLEAREDLQQEVQNALQSLARRSGRLPKVLFHYASKDRAQEIYSTAIIPVAPPSGPFPAGAYATDIAGWLAQSVMTRTELVRRIFGNTSKGNYARTAWFVAFVEDRRSPFQKLAPAIFYHPKKARIKPLVVSPNLLGEN